MGIERIFGGAGAGMKMGDVILSLSFSARAPALVGGVHYSGLEGFSSGTYVESRM